MVKTKGPMMSLNASGTLAGIMQFQQRKGGGCLKKNATPKNPRSAKQTSIRACMKFLSQQWHLIDPTPKATWTERAELLNISPYNAYISTNLERFRNNLGLTQGIPPYATHLDPFDEVTWSNNLIRRICYETYHMDYDFFWGVATLVSTTELEEYSWENVVDLHDYTLSESTPYCIPQPAGIVFANLAINAVMGDLLFINSNEEITVIDL
jgi:hypothetical protein